MGGRLPSESVAGLRRNGWPASVGTGGRIASESVAGLARITQGYIRSRQDPRGYEIMLPRRVTPKEIVRVRVLPKAIGWRYYPEAKGKAPWMCNCELCAARGEVNASRQRA